MYCHLSKLISFIPGMLFNISMLFIVLSFDDLLCAPMNVYWIKFGH